MTKPIVLSKTAPSTKKSNSLKQSLSMQASSRLILITIIALNQICIGHSTDISDIRRLRIRAALSDPVEESCKGSLDYSGFSKLDKICKDCFNLIREPEIYQLCRLDCFCNDFFLFCARDVDRLTEYDISQLPNSCIYINEETTISVSTTERPDTTIDTNTNITPKETSPDPTTENKTFNKND